MGRDDLINVVHFADLFDKRLPRRFQNLNRDVIEQILNEMEHPVTQSKGVVVPLARRESVITHDLVRNPNPVKIIKISKLIGLQK